MKENKEPTEHSHHERTYLLVCDLEELMESFKQTEMNLQIPDPSFFAGMRERLVQQLSYVLPPCHIEVVKYHELCQQLVRITQEAQEGHADSALVSTCPPVAKMIGGHCLQVNRLVNYQGGPYWRRTAARVSHSLQSIPGSTRRTHGKADGSIGRWYFSRWHRR